MFSGRRHGSPAVRDVAFAIAEVGCEIARAALADRRTPRRAESVRAGCPAIHHDEFHVSPRNRLARTGDGRIPDAAFSTIAVRKTGKVIAPANPIIVSTNTNMAESPSLQAIRGNSGWRQLAPRFLHRSCSCQPFF
jgi:hypothetical protein